MDSPVCDEKGGMQAFAALSVTRSFGGVVYMRPNLWVGSAAILIGVVYTIQAFMLPKAMVGNPWAPLYFPIGLGLLMVALGGILVLLEVRKGLKPSGGTSMVHFNPSSLRLIAGTSAACVVYAAMFERIGFVPSTALFLGAMLFMVNGIKSWKLNLVISAAFTAGAWYTFVKLFQINLP
ncbi:MAG: tripartite tricarboxylate transporter TctB family protein [Thermanaerothrix sp.]|nr:tripartite tricarboxylate transporter TctB family protein [Thermanaerothrix sp.]